MNDRDVVLQRIAEAVSDGTSVDWEAEDATSRELAPRLRGMRLVETVASAHRSLSGQVPDSNVSASLQATVSQRANVSSWGPLQLLEKLGEGGFGEVWRAHDPQVDRQVALKLRKEQRTKDDAFAGRFLDEARKLARVRHDNVLIVYGADEHDGREGLWTELVEGKTLEEQLKEQGPLGAHEAARVGIVLCGALAAVHGAGLIHRDVKSSNIMRERGGKIILMDFGSVTAVPRKGQADSSEKVISGTPLSMAPEALRGAVLDASADVYSLGVLLYQLVSTRFPVEAKSYTELFKKHERGETTPLRDWRPDLPAEFVQVVERALARKPNERYASVGAMENALAAAVGMGAPHTGREEKQEEDRPRRIPWWAWAAMAASVALLAFAGIQYWRSPAEPAPSATAVPVRFNVEAEMFRQGREGEGGDTRLDAGAQVQPGDKLFVEIEGSEDMHVYVLNEDEMGEEWLLFPLQGLQATNPLGAGVKHRLPTRAHSWEVTSAGGKERFLLVASKEALPILEQEIARYPEAEMGHPIRMTQGTMPRLRGVGGVARTQPGTTPESHLSDLSEAISAAEESSAGIHLQMFEFDNPSPSSGSSDGGDGS